MGEMQAVGSGQWPVAESSATGHCLLAPSAHRPPPTVFSARLAAHAADRCGLVHGERLVVATSGGVDSSVLFRSLVALGFEAVAVYVHHGLRPEADAEAAFVEAMAGEVGAEAVVVRAPVGAGNRQGAARAVRYAALAAAARSLESSVIATGHTATDQAETVVMALVRGAGLAGLAGMPPRRPLADAGQVGAPLALVRPLLWATRAEIEAHARVHGWPWHEDASNATDAYRRNRIRHHVLPLLDAEGGPGTAARIAAAADAARAALETGPAAHLAARLTTDARGGSLALDALGADLDADRALLAHAHRLFAPAAPRSRAVIERLAELVHAPVGRRVGLGRAVVWRDRDRLRWVVDTPDVEPWSVGPDVTETPFGRLVRTPLVAVPADFRAPATRETVDVEALAGPLVLRRWHAGDRLRPVGGSDRLVSDVLTGARVPPSERVDALVLVSGERVVWLVGHRLAAHAAVTDWTTRAELVEWHPAAGGPAA